MTKPLRTQFVVADAKRARWVQRAGESADFTTGLQVTAEGLARASLHDGPGHGGSGQGAHHDEKRSLVARHSEVFAERIAEIINQQALRHEFDRLAVIAPARLLSPIRRKLSAAAAAALAATLDKDLTHVRDHELAPWLRDLESF